MFIKYKKLSVFYKYIISYLIIFILPLTVMGVVLYTNSVTLLSREVETAGTIKLSQVNELLNTRIKEMNMIAANMSMNYMLYPERIRTGDYKAYQAVQQLHGYTYSNLFIDNVYLFFNDDDSIYSKRGKSSFDVFFNYEYTLDKDGISKFFNDVDLNNQSTVKVVNPDYFFTKEGEEIVFFLYPFPYNKIDTMGTIMFTVKKAIIHDMISDILGGFNCATLITNSEGQVIIWNDNKSGIDIQKFTEELGEIDGTNIQKINIDRNKNVIMSVKSDFTGWRYMTIMPIMQFSEGLTYARELMIKVIIVLLIAGIGISILISLKNYKPIKKLISDLLVQPSNTLLFNARDEIDIIHHAVMEAIGNNKSLKEQVHSHKHLLKMQLVSMLLSGRFRNINEINEMVFNSGIKLPDPFSFVIAIRMKEVKVDYVINQNNNGSFQEFQDMVFSLLPDECKLYATKVIDDDTIVIIINTTDSADKSLRGVILKNIQTYIADSFSICTSIGAGKNYEGILNIDKSYIEAMAAVDYLDSRNVSGIVLFEDIIELQSKKYCYPIEEITRLVQSLKQGNVQVFKEAIKSIMEDITQEHLNIHMVTAICFDIVNSFIKTVNEMNIPVSFIDEANRLVEFSSVDDLYIKMKSIGIKLCEHIHKTKESKNEILRDNILEYIKREYQNCTLNLEGVASTFNISPSYLSRFFKEQTGYTFVEYLKLIRMQKAKELLVSTNKDVKKIVREVGYIDVPNFIRTFKQIEGVTPGQFREIITYKN